MAAHRTTMALAFATLAVSGCGARTELSAPARHGDSGAACPIVTTDVGLTVGRGRACALLSSGEVACWGVDYSGSETCVVAGVDTPCSTKPLVVPGLSDIVSVETSGPITCVLRATGSVSCWGSNAFGALGIGTLQGPETCSNLGPCSHTPLDVQGLSNVTAVALGQKHVCALLSDGTVACWGDNSLGQLGVGTADGPDACSNEPITNSSHHGCSTKPVAVAGLSGVIALAAGTAHTCALLGDGQVACWGANYGGQIGTGSGQGPDPWSTCDEEMNCSTKPFVVKDLDQAAAIAAGDNHMCALRQDGTVRCWGAKDFSQLGIGVNHDTDGCQLSYCKTKPVEVKDLTGVRAIAAGGSFTCALSCDGGMWCWGYNGSGDLGLGENTGPATCHEDNDYSGTCSPAPVAIPGLKGVAAIAAGSGRSSGAFTLTEAGALTAGGTVCAIVENATIECWGDNAFGTLGIGTNVGPDQCAGEPMSATAVSCSMTPVLVSGL